MATVSEVKDGTLELLGILGLGKTTKAKDTLRMDRAYNQVFTELKGTSLATWAFVGPVPDDLVPHVEALMAFNAMDTYYVPAERYTRIVNKEKFARRELRRLTIPDYESLDPAVDY